ncbi:MAG: hypothetical protein JSR37_03585 [Verrucomicrobia bacterium]|nr:hypothetical protein [Verrucomicrobiota bacterium]
MKTGFTPAKIIKIFDRSFVFDHSDLLDILFRPIEVLKVDDRCRLAFYISMSLGFIDKIETTLPQDLCPKMTNAVTLVNEMLAKARASSINTSARPETPPLQFKISKPDIAALPNFIPHAANSCYMAATLVPLAYVYDSLVQASFKKFERMVVTAARDQFRALYTQLKAEAITEISITQVNFLRLALQTSYDYRFFKPTERTQEDAGDFLMCILQDLLQKKPKGHFIEKRTFQPVEPGTEIEPEQYDYSAAFATHYKNLDEVMKDITICQGLTFNELVTGVCPTNDVDRNAYRKDPNGDGPKFRTVMAHNQEQLLVESVENAPEFFCARLRRFSQNPQTGLRTKDKTPIAHSLKVEFEVKESDEKVGYDLQAITVHSGQTLDGGHYYCYLLYDGKIYKYDDLIGVELVADEAKVWQDVLTNGYIFHYKKSTKT